ncbi:hypothetical protein L873DRAFT_569174 [Choiromyces venosus 120613-1]|uniref:Uncharacterized protein n=1 Tax=Choiromyces venosus 120613-1 TaxID=1336337 RepID=A0A3N4JUH2_9PEZI|nr:hypothetical protein L873DRAFT_569174 [Choiromyces venosus 120613-1]
MPSSITPITFSSITPILSLCSLSTFSPAYTTIPTTFFSPIAILLPTFSTTSATLFSTPTTFSPIATTAPSTLISMPPTLSSTFSTTLTHPTSFLFTGTATNLLTKHHTLPTQRPAWHSSPTLSLPHTLTTMVNDFLLCFILFSFSSSSTNHRPPSQLTNPASFNPSTTLPIPSSYHTPPTLTITGRPRSLFSSGSGALPTSFPTLPGPLICSSSTFLFFPSAMTSAQVLDFHIRALGATGVPSRIALGLVGTDYALSLHDGVGTGFLCCSRN